MGVGGGGHLFRCRFFYRLHANATQLRLRFLTYVSDTLNTLKKNTCWAGLNRSSKNGRHQPCHAHSRPSSLPPGPPPAFVAPSLAFLKRQNSSILQHTSVTMNDKNQPTMICAQVRHDFEGLYECRLSNIRGGTIVRTVSSYAIYVFARDPPPLQLKVGAGCHEKIPI